MSRSLARRIVVLAVAGFVIFGATSAWAHETRNVGAVTLRVGWLNEPTYSSSVNAVQLFAAKKGGGAIADAKLTVVVLFGAKDSTTKTAALTLNASDETPGEYTAPIVPSRPGTYTFHITGDAGGTTIDQFFTSSETTFDNVKDPTADEFPAKDPTNGQLAERLNASDSKVSSLESKGTIAIVALALAVLALIVGVVAMTRRGS